MTWRPWLKRIAPWLRLLADWIDPPDQTLPVVMAVPKDALYERALVLTALVDKEPAFSGEAKRHQVYARLLKEFQDTPKRVIARAIEAALEGAA